MESFKATLQAKGGGKESLEQQTFSSSVLNKIVDNVQLVFSNVHIRYEDKHSVPDLPFSFGITLERVAAESANENWEKGIAFL